MAFVPISSAMSAHVPAPVDPVGARVWRRHTGNQAFAVASRLPSMAAIRHPRVCSQRPRREASDGMLASACGIFTVAAAVLNVARKRLVPQGQRAALVVRRAMPTPYGADEYYTRKARAEGKPARSYYKLEELDRRLKLLQPGCKVMDLGCAPGSWTIYAADKVGPKGRVLGLDLKAVTAPMPSNVKTRVQDAFTFDGRGVPPLDVLLSDMAPDTIQDTRTNALRSAETVRQVIRIGDFQLREGGSMIAKLFDGPDTKEIVAELRKRYEKARIMRPDATRNQSPEIYVVGVGRRKVDETAPARWSAERASRRRRAEVHEEARVQAPWTFDGW